jgi:hypothetical protein
MAKERILITVKTYPTLSKTYGETVCTAGIREDGTWVRLYPVPFRRLDEAEKYKKYDWVECRLQRNKKDPRPDSFRPLDPAELIPVAHMDTADEWRERRQLILKKARVYTVMDELIAGGKSNRLSLAVFRPKKIFDFVCEQDSREWDADKLQEMKEMYKQMDMFEDNTWRETFRIIPKLPYSFSYRFEDAVGRKSKLQILDWEVGALFWNCMKSCNNDEKLALGKVREKYLDEFLTKDLHFFLGTTQQFHFIAPNPWVIIGVFPIPNQMQDDLFSP